MNVQHRTIGIGHPVGASGDRLMTSLHGTLEQHDALDWAQLMCEGGGMGDFSLIERNAD